MAIKAWGVFRKSDGILMWWWDGDDRRQFEIFTTRASAISAKKEWLENADEICTVRKVVIGESR